MPQVKQSPLFNDQTVTSTGAPASGYKVYTYAAGSTTQLATYTDSSGSTPQTNPIILNSLGRPTNGPIWLQSGLSYKFVLQDASGVQVGTPFDNVTGVNDTSSTTSQWLSSGAAPTYVSATSFTLAGDQTTEFHVGRRLQFTVTAGTVYGVITRSSYSALTTVTVIMDSGMSLDSGLSVVNLSILRADRSALPTPTVTIPRGYLAGLTMSTAGSSTTMSIAAGQATDSTSAAVMAIAASIGKTTSAWAVGSGNGGLDTGAIANNTWYHFFLIQRTDTGLTDVIFSTNAAVPALPANYTYYRRIGSGRTNGSGQWTAFTQDGDYFRWAASVNDVGTTNPGAVAVTPTLTVPTGVNVTAMLNATLIDTAAAGYVALLSDLSANDEAPAATGAPLAQLITQAGNQYAAWGGQIRTNTSAQIRYRLNASAASTSIRIATYGWIDTRGKNA
jgi:hypothetical protein